MDLGDLRGMPKVLRGKSPIARSVASTQGVSGAPPTEALKSSCKRPSDSPVPPDNPSRRHKKVKILSRRHKSHHGEGSQLHSKGKELAEPVEEPETVFHRPRSMKDLFKMKVHKDDAGYYALHMFDLAHQDPDKEMQSRWWGLLHPLLMRELYTLPSEVLLARATKEMVLQEIDALKSRGGPKAVAAVEECASELEKELEKTKREQDEVLQRLEASDKELNKVQSNLSEIQKLLNEARVRAQKLDDELLQSMKALENV
ncbi:hypothetical protein B296_00039960 [Ensete ventricosum]|uniref:Uncharacterized protein n=1 Tax=Ensete ventricosum TaxID=4639 RepID=A0A426XBN0_ENSVE|nr:hypothetical protein B296_00039960 [Ensete ventricosum]